MIEITRKQWDNIHKDYKGAWSELIVNIHGLPKNWVGKKNVMAGCIKKNGGTALLTEDVHFKIID